VQALSTLTMNAGNRGRFDPSSGDEASMRAIV
jgi:hypothetical protein